jgi:hypothetical protein
VKDRILDSLTIQQYHEGTLDPRKMHELEKQSLEDDFLSDALEGYTYVIEPAEKLSLLQQRLADRILEQEANKKAFSITSQRLSIAAASGLMFILAVILFWMNGYKAADATKQVEVNLAVRPSKTQSNAAKVSKGATAVAGSMASPVFALAEQSLSRSEPVKGWNEYTKYIEGNIGGTNPSSFKNSVNSIIIAFKVSESGTPVDLKVVDGISDEFSAKVIRLIESGPLWKPLDSEEVKVRVNFKR